MKLIELSEKRDFTTCLNSEGKINLQKLFSEVQNFKEYEDLQFFLKREIDELDEDDERRELLEDVEEGGAMLWHYNSTKQYLFTADEMKNGCQRRICLADFDFYIDRY